MGTLITTDLITEVTDHLAGRSDVTDARIVRALNLAQEYIARSHDFEELRVRESSTLPFTTTPASDKFFPFSSLTNTDPHEIWSFRIVTGDGRSRKLQYRDTRTFDRVIPEPEFYSVGIPSIYTIWEDNFELWKVQQQAYTYDLRMTKWPTALSTTLPNAVSTFKQKDDLLLFLAVSWIFGSLGEYERGRNFFGFYAARMASARSEDDKHPDREIKAIGGEAEPDVVLGRPWSDPFVRHFG